MKARLFTIAIYNPIMTTAMPQPAFKATIKIDDLRGPEIAALLEEHMAGMRASSPACSVHALDLEGLRHPAITFWSAWDGAALMGCGAVRELDATHGEIKSMRTSAAHLRKGVAGQILAHIITVAQERGYQRLSLETGSTPDFAAAHALYANFGFTQCGPFGGYVVDPFSVFMTKVLA
jgi:putative acetyltransferase